MFRNNVQHLRSTAFTNGCIPEKLNLFVATTSAVMISITLLKNEVVFYEENVQKLEKIQLNIATHGLLTLSSIFCISPTVSRSHQGVFVSIDSEPRLGTSSPGTTRNADPPPPNDMTFWQDAAINKFHDDVIKWKYFPRYWPFVRGIHRPRWIPRTKASDAELWCFLWSASE